MRTPHCHFREPLRLLLWVVVPLLISPTAVAYSLADVQQISGFGSACTNAYSTPFTICTSNDFNGNQGCSTACAASLAALLANVDEACNGHTAFPDTLIGQIFSGDAYDTLCPGSSGSAGSSGGSAGGRGGGGSNSGNGQASAHLSLATNLVASQTSTTLAPKVIQSSTSSYGLHSYLTPIATPATTPKQSYSSTPALSTIPSTTLQTSTPTSISTVPLSELTRVTTKPTTTTQTSAAAATSLSTTPTSSTTSQETSQGSNPQGAGGGTPFDIASDSCRKERSLLWTISVVPTAIFVLLWLV